MDTLKGGAQCWWVLEIELGTPTTWEEFLVWFKKWYYVKAFQDRKQRERLSLTQEGISVHKYATKYTRLLHFPEVLLSSEAEK